MHRLSVGANGQGLVDITEPVCHWVATQRIAVGLLTVWCRHTSASLLVQENADPDVRTDLEAFFNRLVPEKAGYRHEDEGPDDMPAHIKAALTQTQLTVPVDDGRPGTRHLAGHLPVRAPRRASSAGDRSASDRRVTQSHQGPTSIHSLPSKPYRSFGMTIRSMHRGQMPWLTTTSLNPPRR